MTISRYILFMLFMCILSGNSGAAYAIDCKSAATKREQAVCGSDRLLALDMMLNKAYREELSLETNPRYVNKDRNLRREQLAWIKVADKCRSDTPCIREAYARRYVSLRAYSDFRFMSMENLSGLADILEPWASADPVTGGVPLAARSKEENIYLLAVPVSFGKPLPFYEVYFMQPGQYPERLIFPDLLVPQEMIKESNSGKFAIEDLTVTSGTRFQGVSLIGLDVVSKTMSGGAGREWIQRRWRVNRTGADGVSPTLMEYAIENVRDGFTVKVVGLSGE